MGNKYDFTKIVFRFLKLNFQVFVVFPSPFCITVYGSFTGYNYSNRTVLLH